MRAKASLFSLSLFLAVLPVVVHAQIPRAWDGEGGDNNWLTVENWEEDFYPTGDLDETAVIDSGVTVLIDVDLGSGVLAPDMPPAGLTVSNGSVLEITDTGAYRTVLPNDGGATGAATFTGGGTLGMTGGATLFESTSLSFNGGVYAPNITSGSHGLISVSGPLALEGGSLRPSFGFSPSPQSWVLADAASITGALALDTSALSLSSGQIVRTSVEPGGSNGLQLILSYDQVLVLSANADTGEVTISSPTGTSVDMTAYSITSSAGDLVPAEWAPLETQLGGGWSVAGTPSSSQLEELAGPSNATTQDMLTVGVAPQSLGDAYGVSLPFQTAPSQSLSFQYVTAQGEVVDGAVEFTGLNAVNNLLLTVDPDTGLAELKNSSTTTFEIRGYTVSSDDGSLLPGTWNSLHDQLGATIDEASPSADDLSELIPLVENALELSPGEAYPLGTIFDTLKDRDLQLEFLISTDGPLDGDFNNDGSVDAADYAFWRNNDGSPADYALWRQNYGSTGGGSGGVQITNGVVLYDTLVAPATVGAPVPEPSSVLAMVIASFGLAAFRRREK